MNNNIKFLEEEEINDSDKLDKISNDLEIIMSKLNLSDNPEKKKKNKKFPDDFDWSDLDNFVINTFSNVDSGINISRNTLFESFVRSGSNKNIKLNKHDFESRCNKLLIKDIVYFGLKK